MNLSFTELKKVLGIELKNPKEAEIIGFSTDTRTIKEGEIFVSLSGENFDGNSFITEAKEKGASGFIASKTSKFENYDNIFLVGNTLEALQKIAKFYLQKLNIPTILITGSCGKTTAKDMLNYMFAKNFCVKATRGNLNNHIGLPLTALGLRDENLCILEAGISAPGEMEMLSEIARPDIAVITNIGKAHLEKLGSLRGVAKAKLELVKNIKKNGHIILNGDDELLLEEFEIISEKLNRTDLHMHKFGFGKNNDTSVKISANKEKTEIQISIDENIYFIDSAISGKPGAYSNAICMAIAKAFDHVNLGNYAELLSKYTAESTNRFHRINVAGKTLVNDTYNSNPMSLEEGINTLYSFYPNQKKILVIGDMLELGEKAEEEHVELARRICQKISNDIVITYGQYSKAISEYFNKNLVRSYHFDTKEKVLDKLIEIIPNADIAYFKSSRKMKLEEVLEEFKKYIEKCL